MVEGAEDSHQIKLPFFELGQQKGASPLAGCKGGGVSVMSPAGFWFQATVVLSIILSGVCLERSPCDESSSGTEPVFPGDDGSSIVVRGRQRSKGRGGAGGHRWAPAMAVPVPVPSMLLAALLFVYCGRWKNGFGTH